jgi:late competence protein required for DNA uptake (superfamily II DNA/RNA helicase)
MRIDHAMNDKQRTTGDGRRTRGDASQVNAEIVCPFCASRETELFSLFSQFLLCSQYYCRSCKTVFDVVRWQEPPQKELDGIPNPTI